MSTTTNDIPITFAGVESRGTVPNWAREFDVTRSTVAELCAAATLSGIAVVQSAGPRVIIEQTDKFTKLFELISQTADLHSRLIFGFKNTEAEEFLKLAPLLAKFPGLSSRVDMVRQASDLHDTLFEAMTKVLAAMSEQDPFAKVPSIMKTDRSLRASSGRLDAGKIASTFGITIAELARQIGVTRQRINKTSDAEALQPLLRPYERIARLRSVLSEADFKAWLHTPNDLLEDREAPIDYLKDGAREPLAAVAENMLTGAST